MKRWTLNDAMLGMLLIGVVTAAAGCHKNQSAQSAPAESAQSAAQPAANPDTGATAAATTPAPAPAAAPASTAPEEARASKRPASHAPASAPSPQPGTAEQATNSAPQAPASVVIPDGTALRIRIDQHISTKTSEDGDRFSGTIVQPVSVNGTAVIPAGSIAHGQVVAAERGGRFKGRPELKLTLVALDVNGRHYNLDTSSVVRTQNGKGKRTAAFIGGGAGAGMLIGGVASGGVGLLVGGLTGAAAGTMGAAFTGHRDIDIPAETVMTFRLDQPIQLQ